jgi:hypothetical protein
VPTPVDAASPIHFPRFKTPEGRARYLAAYDAALGGWPVSYETLRLTTRLRPTLALAMRRLPGLQGAVIQDADHIAAMAQPDEVNARILAFLRGATDA